MAEEEQAPKKVRAEVQFKVVHDLDNNQYMVVAIHDARIDWMQVLGVFRNKDRAIDYVDMETNLCTDTGFEDWYNGRYDTPHGLPDDMPAEPARINELQIVKRPFEVAAVQADLPPAPQPDDDAEYERVARALTEKLVVSMWEAGIEARQICDALAMNGSEFLELFNRLRADGKVKPREKKPDPSVATTASKPLPPPHPGGKPKGQLGDRSVLITKLWNEGVPAAEIARQCGPASAQAIYNRVQKLGLKARQINKAPRPAAASPESRDTASLITEQEEVKPVAPPAPKLVRREAVKESFNGAPARLPEDTVAGKAVVEAQQSALLDDWVKLPPEPLVGKPLRRCACNKVFTPVTVSEVTCPDCRAVIEKNKEHAQRYEKPRAGAK